MGGGTFAGPPRIVRAVDGMTLDIRARETFALVGESDCGKTALGREMLRLQEPTSGTIQYHSTELTGLGEAPMRALRKTCRSYFKILSPR